MYAPEYQNYAGKCSLQINLSPHKEYIQRSALFLESLKPSYATGVWNLVKFGFQ